MFFFSDLWPSFPNERVLYRDESLIIVDKPVNVSTHAPDGTRADDAYSRVRQMIAELERTSVDQVYLGIHQRLDRDTSGVLLFTTEKAANAAIAAQFEHHKVEKTYVAAVAGWPDGRESGVLRDWLVPSGSGSRMSVWHEPQSRPGPKPETSPGRRRNEKRPVGRRPSGRRALGKASSSHSHTDRHKGGVKHAEARMRPPPKAQEAITRFRVLARVGKRALLELTPQTGRTHQIRVQLADRGAAIAGDPWYGGSAAPRLLLHARSLALQHPVTSRRLVIDAPVPPEFEEWLSGRSVDPLSDSEKFHRVLRAAIDSRWGVARSSSETTAFRLVHGDGEGLPGCAVDRYGDYFVLHVSNDAMVRARPLLITSLRELGPRGIYYKSHPKQSNTLVDPRKEELAPAHAVWGDDAPDPMTITENGLVYLVRLGDGLKTGIFLDQRENRRRVRELSSEKSVLNLFAYTCAFTVAAAAGAAKSSVSVDVSASMLAWGPRNLAANAFEAESHVFIAEDVFAWLPRAGRSGQRYDLVILDPPSYATTHSSRFVAETDYPELAAQALRVVSDGGRMLACTNHRGISSQKFRRFMHDAARLAGRELVQIKDLPPPPDFPPGFGNTSHLKSALVTLA